MVKNIIFDLGNVLIKYDPKTFIETYVSEKNREQFISSVFHSDEWQDLDRGTLSYEKAVEVFSERNPEEKIAVERLFKNNIQDALFPNMKNIEFVKRLKEENYKLYILSNFHRESFEMISEKLEFEKFFDGKIVSCYCHLLKPEKEIYDLILGEYNLSPEETLFIDDTKANIEKAKELGIQVVHLTSLEELEKKVREKL